MHVCHTILRAKVGIRAESRITLTHEERFLRRKVLTTEAGEQVLVDLPKAVSLRDGDALQLDDGRVVAIHAASEPLLELRGDLARLAWHIGNRHTPCQIEAGRLLIARDHVLRDMLAHLGATIREVTEPFEPESGAYGHGRTHGHAH
ncbi:urease accessory protein [Albidovulum inexpectatum]|uniref:Urease accessory protein UreE n=1 Tax=Albidovulum inexpectatum TaxID=196587 RepID=A0A2S5JH68_9RHOB|nr:urease accessory protein UreE [Albidovulum inexpectatum]PPB80802.1 urease accessory protein [Albidovulum inexpectatum]